MSLFVLCSCVSFFVFVFYVRALSRYIYALSHYISHLWWGLTVQSLVVKNHQHNMYLIVFGASGYSVDFSIFVQAFIHTFWLAFDFWFVRPCSLPKLPMITVLKLFRIMSFAGLLWTGHFQMLVLKDSPCGHDVDGAMKFLIVYINSWKEHVIIAR